MANLCREPGDRHERYNCLVWTRRCRTGRIFVLLVVVVVVVAMACLVALPRLPIVHASLQWSFGPTKRLTPSDVSATAGSRSLSGRQLDRRERHSRRLFFAARLESPTLGRRSNHHLWHRTLASELSGGGGEREHYSTDRNNLPNNTTNTSNNSFHNDDETTPALEHQLHQQGGDDFLLVSDAEALLACRAHLQRTNQLGEWTAGLERQRQRQLKKRSMASNPSLLVQSIDDDDEQPMSSFTNEPMDEERVYVEFKDEDSTRVGAVSQHDPAIAWSSVLQNAQSDLFPKYSDDREIIYNGLLDNVHLQSLHGGNTVVEIASDVGSMDFPIRFQNKNNSSFSSVGVFSLSSDALQHQRRSNAAKQRFANPQWKGSWYERRWGRRLDETADAGGKLNVNHNNASIEQTSRPSNKKKDRLLKARMRAPHMEHFLSNPLLAEMSEEEIATAIQTYVQSNEKRATTHRQQSAKKMRASGNESTVAPMYPTNITAQPKLERDFLYRDDAQALQEKRQKRASTAARIYHRRLENRKQRQSSNQSATINSGGTRGNQQQRGASQDTCYTTMSIETNSTQLPVLTPRDALYRIQHNWLAFENSARTNVGPIDFDSANWHSLERDVKLIIQPKKLSQRKDVLRRLLSQVFNMRGKVGPLNSRIENGRDEMVFVTKCTLKELGELVLTLIRQYTG